MSERVSMYDLVGMIHAELSRGIERKMMPDLAAAREVDDLLVDLNARLNEAHAEVDRLQVAAAESAGEQRRLRGDIDGLVVMLNNRYGHESPVTKLLRSSEEHNAQIVAIEERRFALIERHATEQLAVINRNTDALEKIAAAVGACPGHAVETGAIVRGEPPAEQATCDITTFVPDSRPHQESQNGSCYCDACCVKAGLAPAEQPSRQGTPGGETERPRPPGTNADGSWADGFNPSGPCRPWCGKTYQEAKEVLHHSQVFQVGASGHPTLPMYCTLACRDRAQAEQEIERLSAGWQKSLDDRAGAEVRCLKAKEERDEVVARMEQLLASESAALEKAAELERALEQEVVANERARSRAKELAEVLGLSVQG